MEHIVQDEHDFVVATQMIGVLEAEAQKAELQVGEGLGFLQGLSTQLLQSQVKVMNGIIAYLKDEISTYKAAHP